MDLLTGDIKRIYRRYLFAGVGSAVISSVYSTVDMVVTGQYEGPMGAAALSVVSPMWTVFMSIGLLFGIGGSILMSVFRSQGSKTPADEFFTVSLFAGGIVSAVLVVLFALFREEFLYLCGADAEVLPYALAYSKWLVPAIPFFLVGTVLSAFIRNDEAPMLATVAIIAGGVLNVFGDIYFVFDRDMGIEGAGLATMLGQMAAFILLCSHFFSKKSGLRIVRPERFFDKLYRIISAGFSTFIVDVSFGLIVVLFNNQVMRYSDSVSLAVLGTIINVTVLIQSLFYGVGQAVQPIVSSNMGAGRPDRVKSALGYSLMTAGIMGAVFFALTVSFPEEILKLYMDVTESVMEIGPAVVRRYSLAFLLMGINIVASYYFQAVMQSRISLTISLLRGFVIYSALVLSLPALFGFDAIWWTMPVTELLTLIVTLTLLRRTAGGKPAP